MQLILFSKKKFKIKAQRRCNEDFELFEILNRVDTNLPGAKTFLGRKMMIEQSSGSNEMGI